MNQDRDRRNLLSSLQALKDRYPYMFAGENIGFGMYRGWFPLFAQLCTDIDAVLGGNQRGFHWVQTKEKFGSYRMYYQLEPDPDETSLAYEAVEGAGHVQFRPKAKPASATAPASPAQAIRTLVNRAEDATARMCMACGQPAKTRSFDGYFLTLCQEHAPSPGLTRSRARWEKVWRSVRVPEDGEGGS